MFAFISSVLSTNALQQARENDVALSLILVAKLLAIGALLALGPDVHLSGTNADEKSHRPVTADDNDANPSHNLKHVVGASDETEAITVGDLALGAAGRSESRQIVVDETITILAKDK